MDKFTSPAHLTSEPAIQSATPIKTLPHRAHQTPKPELQPATPINTLGCSIVTGVQCTHPQQQSSEKNFCLIT